jgi:hypothetical protein
LRGTTDPTHRRPSREVPQAWSPAAMANVSCVSDDKLPGGACL